jgi:hypothetical protein
MHTKQGAITQQSTPLTLRSGRTGTPRPRQEWWAACGALLLLKQMLLQLLLVLLQWLLVSLQQQQQLIAAAWHSRVWLLLIVQLCAALWLQRASRCELWPAC